MAFLAALRSALSATPLLLLIFTWLAMAELLQGLEDGYSKPAFLTYVVHSGYGTALVPWLLLWRARRASGRPPPVSAQRLVLAACPLSIGAYAVAMTWYISLPLTSVAANTAVYTSASAFVVFLSVPILGHAVTLAKLAAVALSITGVALVAFGSSSASSSSGGAPSRDTPAGFAWVIASTAGYAVYEVGYAWLASPPKGSAALALHTAPDGAATSLLLSSPRSNVSNEGKVDGEAARARGGEHEPEAAGAGAALADKAEAAALVLGAMGVWTLVLLWPALLVANAAGWEPFEAPPPDKARLLALNVALDTLYNLSLLWGIATTSPLTMSVATTLVVPVGILVDWIVHGTLPTLQALGGAVLIVSSILVLHAPRAWWAACASVVGLRRCRGQRGSDSSSRGGGFRTLDDHDAELAP